VCAISSTHSNCFIFLPLIPLPTAHYCDSFLLGGGAGSRQDRTGWDSHFPFCRIRLSHFPLPIKEAPADSDQDGFEAVDSSCDGKKIWK